MALFAACTNDDFISNEQGIQSGDAAMRPTVDVTLNVLGDGADTRLAFDSEDGYEWQTNDTIGALLMDKVLGETRPHQEEWKDLVWTQKYGLVDYINTDYPFVRQSDGTWQTNAKMLEGNYFFSFPYASYTGNREAVHSLGEQIQDGTSAEALREAYAKNQFFVGYARIHAGTEGGDVMSANLEMTPMLGAVGVTVKSVGTGTLQVKKIVLQSEDFSTLIKIDPTKALYKGENGNHEGYVLDGTKLTTWGNVTGDNYFNYANYEEMQRSGDTWTYLPEFAEKYADETLVNNTEKSANYNRQEALRAVVNPIKEGVGADDRAELTVLNAPVQKAQEEANFLIMTNIYENKAEAKPIFAYVYTDRGMAGPVQISSVKGEIETDENGVTSVITNNPIVEIAPGVTNKVTLEIDNNSVQDPENMNTYNEEDLLQFIEWNQDKARVYTASLQNDVVLTKEMTDLLTAKGVTSKLQIYTNGKKLYIDEDAATNILDYVYVSYDADNKDANSQSATATIIVNNDLTLGTNSLVSGTHTPGSINKGNITLSNQLEVAEGASVTVSSDIKYLTSGDHKNQALTIAKNEGTVTINGAVDKLTIAENKAEVEINKNVTFAANSKNKENAVITIGEGATVNCGNATTSYLWNVGKKDEYAVIYNNGTIMNLDNQAWGKVIAGAKSTTNVNNNAENGIIDISSSIKANWKINGTNNGHVSYTATAAQPVSITDVKNSLITELVLDGGTITAVDAETGKDKSADATATSVTKIVVKENGGVLGEAEKNEANTKIHERTSFPKVKNVETNGNVTFYDVDLAIANAFDVKAGTTTIKGTVNAEKATFTLGSYDDKQYVAHDGTLSIPTKFDELNAAQITKKSGTGHDTKFDAVVMNQGLVNLPKGVQHGVGDGWKGNEPGEIKTGETGTPDKVESQDGVYTVDGTSSLIEDAKKDFSDVATIKIITAIRPSEDEYEALKTIVSGRELILTDGTLSLGNGNGTLSAKKLTVEGAKVGVSTSNMMKNDVMLTVESVEVKSGAALTVYDAWILVNQNVREGSSTGLQINGTVTYDSTRPGAIVAINNADTAGAYLEMNTTSKKWE